MTEQSDPKSLVRYAAAAEQRGCDFEVMSDHYFPWLDSMGHAPNAWATLGAVAQATERVELMTYVTCPTMRYHPAVVAQQAATVDLLSDGRFTLGLGAGENLNEHVVGRGWPPVNVRAGDVRRGRRHHHRAVRRRLRRLRRRALPGRLGAKLWDLGTPPPRIGIAVSGTKSCDPGRREGRRDDRGRARRVARRAVRRRRRVRASRASASCRSATTPTATPPIDRAHDLFRWFGGGWKVNADLPGHRRVRRPRASSCARTTSPSRSRAAPDVGAVVEAVKQFTDAGFTHVALVQIGGGPSTRTRSSTGPSASCCPPCASCRPPQPAP